METLDLLSLLWLYLFFRAGGFCAWRIILYRHNMEIDNLSRVRVRVMRRMTLLSDREEFASQDQVDRLSLALVVRTDHDSLVLVG
jgi:hypothetical protein